MPFNYLKLGVSGVLRFLPGEIGAKNETRFLWARRATKLKGTQDIFNRHLAELTENSVCIDFGANLGTISRELLTKAGLVHAFEPDPWTFSQLKERIGPHERIVFHNKAIGDRDGQLTMFRAPSFNENPAGKSQGTSMYQSALWEDGEPEEIAVEVIDICRFLQELGKPVDIMKMDIEGAELDVLDRLLDSPEINMVKAIFVETHEAQMPQLRERTQKLRDRVKHIASPKIYLDWV